MTQSAKDFKSDSITTVIADTISNISTSISNVASNVSTLTTSVADVQTTITTIATPKISSITYAGDDTAADPAGGQTITLNGLNFVTGATVLINNQAVSVVSVVDSETITFTSPALAAGSYIVYVINTDGGTGIAIPGIQYSGTPAWSTAAGTLGTIYETAPVSQTLSAAGDEPVTYSLVSGTLPPGSTLNANGTITGTSESTSSSTTYTFTIKASDAQNQDTDRQFSITVNPDVVTWNTPSSGATITIDGAYSSALTATSAAGQSITYTANALPDGLTLSSGTISGTPTVEGNVSTLLTATSTNTNRTATNTITWVIILGDSYWKYTSLLLSGSTPTTTFINDASLNNHQLTITGDTKPNNFNPYTPGYYSNYLDGSSYILGTMSTGVTIGTSDFCLEGWGYWTSFDYGQYGSPLISLLGASAGELMIRANKTSASTTTANWFSILGGGTYIPSAMYSSGVSGGTLYTNRWHHLAVQRASGTWYFYIDGVLITSTSAGDSSLTLPFTKYYIGNDSGGSGGYLAGNASNIRFTVGSVPYATAGFTVLTAPLSAGADTKFLSAQSNRFIDNSTNNAVMTVSGTAKVQTASPFAANSSYSTYGSVYFDGTGDYLSVPNSRSLYLESGDFTIEFWYNSSITFNTGYGPCIGFGYKSTPTGGWVIYRNTSVNTDRISLRVAGQGGAGMVDFPTTSTVEKDVWNHWAVVRSGTSLKWYKNGVLDASTTNSVNITDTDATTLGYIGYAQQWGYYTQGYLSEVRVVKGSALYTTTFTPPTAPLTPVTNTQLLTLQYNGGANNNGFVDQSSFNNIITRNGNATQGTFSPYSQTGWSYYFDGSGDYLTVPYNSNICNWWDADYTIECWIYNITNGQSTENGLPLQVSSGDSNASTTYWSFGTLSNGKLQFYYYNGTTVTNAVSTAAVSPSTWTHIAMVHSNTYATLTGYINGTEVFSVAKIGTPQNTGYQLNIGRVQSTTYNGYVSNLRIVKGTRIYTSAFTPSTTPLSAVTNTSILTCQNNRIIDNSPNNFTITKAGDVSVQAYSPFGGITSVPASYSNYFDGTGDYLSTVLGAPLDLTSTSPFTIEFWLYMPALPSVLGYVFHTTYAGTATYCYISSTGIILFGSSSGGTRTQSNSALSINTWYHVAICRSGGTERMFINGTTQTQTSGQLTHSLGTLYFGTDSSQNYYTNFYLSNFRIIKLTGLYSSNFTVPAASLTAIANTVLLTCQSATMIDNSTNNFAITATGDVKPRPFNPFGTTTTTNVSYTPAVNGGSMYFDGTGDYLTLPTSTNYNLTGDFTIEAWLYPTAQLANAFGIFDARVNGGTAAAWVTGLVNSSGYKLEFFNGTSYKGTITIPINQWVHVAWTRSGSALASFVNGVRDYYNASFGTTAMSPGSTAPRVGTKDNGIGGYETAGYISDLRFINGTAKYTNSFVPAVSPAIPTNNTILLLNGTSGGIIDYHGTNNLETVGNTQLASEDPYSGSYYSLALSSSGYLTTPANAAFDLATASSSFTLEAWVYFNSYNSMSSSAAVIAGNHQSSNGWFWGWYGVGTISYLTLTVNPSGTAANFTMDTSVIPLGKWIHVATVNNAGTLTTYINGTAVGGTQSYAGYTGSGGQLAIGVYQQNLGYAGNPDWLISNLRITKGQALYTGSFTPSTAPLTPTSQGASASNVSLLACQSNTFKDNSTNNFTLTRNTAGSVKSKNPFQQNTGKSLYFDGTGDYLSSMQLASPNLDLVACDFTIEGWVYNASPGAEHYILSQRGSSSGWELRINSTNLMQFFFTGGSTLTSTAVIPSHQWVFIAVTRSANNLKIYINGTLDATNASFTNGTSAASAYPVYVGNSTSAGGGLFLGYIKDLRITKYARYTTTFTPPTTPMQIK